MVRARARVRVRMRVRLGAEACGVVLGSASPWFEPCVVDCRVWGLVVLGWSV